MDDFSDRKLAEGDIVKIVRPCDLRCEKCPDDSVWRVEQIGGVRGTSAVGLVRMNEFLETGECEPETVWCPARCLEHYR
jgi:hypothetical protein